MPEDVLMHLMTRMIWVAMLLALPPLGAAMIMGLLIGLLQAVTSIQEQTLTFVPKIITIVLVLVLLGAWMLRVVVGYSQELLVGLPHYGAL